MGDSGLPWKEGSLPQIKRPCPRPKEQLGNQRVVNRMEVQKAFDGSGTGQCEPKPPAKSAKASSSIVKQRRVKKARLPAAPKPYLEELNGVRALLKQCHERRGNSSRSLSSCTMCPQRPLLERRAQMDRHGNAERLCAPVPPSQHPQVAQKNRRRVTRLVGADDLRLPPLG